MKGYIVENIALKTLPGYYLTGNLYSPDKKMTSLAGVLSPHGHFKNPDGRFQEQVQKRCATLARMGAVVFAYDMIGYGDNNQCNHELSKAMKLQTYNSVRALDFLLSFPILIQQESLSPALRVVARRHSFLPLSTPV